jgi:hypothetical protein
LHFLSSILQHKTGGQTEKIFGPGHDPATPHKGVAPFVDALEVRNIAVAVPIGFSGLWNETGLRRTGNVPMSLVS